MTYHVVVEVPFRSAPMQPVTLAALRLPEAIQEVERRFENTNIERANLYLVTQIGEMQHIKLWIRDDPEVAREADMAEIAGIVNATNPETW